MASPLSWPVRQPRTERYARKRNALWNGATVSTASAQIDDEVRRMGGRDLIVSTNLALRIDGFPRSGQPEPNDPGVAVYFTRKGQQLVFACDRYQTVRENLRAVGMHLAAIRGQERWGVGSLDQAFAGYAALPDPDAPRHWSEVLGIKPEVLEQLRAKAHETRHTFLEGIYRHRARSAHPDGGGSHEAFVELRRAYEAARLELGVA